MADELRVSGGESEHSWVHENLGAYLAGGLSEEERSRLDGHVNGCPECFDALMEARDADRAMARALGGAGGVVPEGDLESRVARVVRVRMGRTITRVVRRAGYAAAACVALGAVGAFAHTMIRRDLLNNEMTKELAARSDEDMPTDAMGGRWWTWGEKREKTDAEKAREVAAVSSANHAATNPSEKYVVARTEGELKNPMDEAFPIRASTDNKNLLNATLGQSLVMKERSDTLYSTAIAASEKARAENRFSQAASYAQEAIDVVNNNHNYFTDTEERALRDAAQVQLAAAKSREDAYRNAQVMKGMEEAKVASGDREIALQNQKKDAVDALVRDADKLVSASQFAQARDLLQQAVIINPQDERAHLALRLVENRVNDRAYEDLIHRTGSEVAQHSVDSAEHLVPSAVSPGNGVDWRRDGQNVAMGDSHAEYQKSPLSGSEDAANKMYYTPSGTASQGGNVAAAREDEKDRRYVVNGGNLQVQVNGLDNGIDSFSQHEKLVDTNNLRASNFGITAGSDFGMAGVVHKYGDDGTSVDANQAQKIAVEDRPGELTPKVDQLLQKNSELARRNNDLENANRSADQATRKLQEELTASNNGKDKDGKMMYGFDIPSGESGKAMMEKKEPVLGNIPLVGEQFKKSGSGANEVTDLATAAGQKQALDVVLGQLPSGGQAEPGGQPGTVTDGSFPTPAEKPARAGDGKFDANKATAGKGVSTSSGMVGQVVNNDAVGSPGSFDTTLTPPANSFGYARDTRAGDAQGIAAGTKVELPIGNRAAATQLAAAAGNSPTSGAPATLPAAPPATRGSAPASAVLTTKKIITSGNIEFEVVSFDAAASTVDQVVTEEGGTVASMSSERLGNGKVRGVITVRVPPENVERFLMKLRALGDLKARQIGSKDVTKEYVDVESELRGLRATEEGLMALIKSGKGEVKDLVEAESKLGDYRVRIEKLEGQKRYYDNLVGMATIDVTVFEKDIQKPTAASEQENVNVSVETEEVEAKYAAARKVLDDVKARIVESQLKNTDAEHFAATITADVTPAKADIVAAQLKQLGKVANFTRDRHQTTTGGTGAPAAGLPVEVKDTRFSISLYNLANLQPRETAVLTVAVKDVEGTYKKILGQVKPPAPAAPAPGGAEEGADQKAPGAGRVVSSSINGNAAGVQPEQMSADITAEIRADASDALVQAIRDSGEVLVSSTSVNQDGSSSTTAKRGVRVHIVNIATVQPREGVGMTIAVKDVEGTVKKIAAVMDRPSDGGGVNGSGKTGRIISQGLNGQQPETMTADIRSEVKADQNDAVLAAIRDMGEVLGSNSAQNPDMVNVTNAKRGITLRLVNSASVAAREQQNLKLVANDVGDAYGKLMNTLQGMVAAGKARVIISQLVQNDPRNVTATVRFDVERDSVAAAEKAITDAGLDFVGRSVNRSTDPARLDTKVAYFVDEIKSGDALDPRRTFILGREVEDVGAAMDKFRGMLPPGVKELEYSTSKDASGKITGHISLDVPTANTMGVMGAIRDLGGIERENVVSKNAQVPDTKFSKDRVDLTVVGRPLIVESGKGLGSTSRAAMSSAAGALLYSVYLVMTGVLFLLPFAVIGWPVWAMVKRSRRKDVTKV